MKRRQNPERAERWARENADLVPLFRRAASEGRHKGFGGTPVRLTDEERGRISDWVDETVWRGNRMPGTASDTSDNIACGHPLDSGEPCEEARPNNRLMGIHRRYSHGIVGAHAEKNKRYAKPRARAEVPPAGEALPVRAVPEKPVIPVAVDEPKPLPKRATGERCRAVFFEPVDLATLVNLFGGDSRIDVLGDRGLGVFESGERGEQP